ncbi:GDSL-type esterase/lipase family protein [Microcella alkaliphila]|uniref:Putative esterase/lipase n=1 Tax=Microcella alkaliphila TaxID=279828 RepID=A0A0U5CI91_9MICO|nr:GDSL-type esterase/lipase family protein [Microcella alkaliphila]BAU33490.1 putative esterase/lipase [Microcella alkaliphila]
MTWSPRTPFVRRRLDEWRRRADEAGELLYVALGDSAALGVGVRDLDASYVGLAAHRLQRLSFRTVRVVNLARYGARADDVLDRQLDALSDVERVAGRPADMVTLDVGGNDAGRTPADEADARIHEIVRRLPAHAIVADVPCFHFGEREWDARRLSRTITDAAHAAGLALAPLHRVTELRRGWGSFPDFAWDQFHPSRRGYRVWDSAFAGAVGRRARELRADVGGSA